MPKAEIVQRAAAAMPWDRLKHEPLFDHAHFTMWLNLDPRPAPFSPAVSIKFQWAPRAAAFDAYQQVSGLPPKVSAMLIFEQWTTVILNESRKWLHKSLEQEDTTIEPKQIQGFIELVTDPSRNQAGRVSHDLSALSSTERSQLLQLLEKAKTEA